MYAHDDKHLIPHLAAQGSIVHQRRDLGVGVDLDEPRGELVALNSEYTKRSVDNGYQHHESRAPKSTQKQPSVSKQRSADNRCVVFGLESGMEFGVSDELMRQRAGGEGCGCKCEREGGAPRVA